MLSFDWNIMPIEDFFFFNVFSVKQSEWLLQAFQNWNTNVSYKQQRYIWAATWQNQQSDCAPSEDSDQPGHPPSLIRVFAVCMDKAWVLSYPLSAHQILWSDWADTQADLSLRWAHSHIVGFVMLRLSLIYLLEPQDRRSQPHIYHVLKIRQHAFWGEKKTAKKMLSSFIIIAISWKRLVLYNYRPSVRVIWRFVHLR